jgi:hypothetical protein
MRKPGPPADKPGLPLTGTGTSSFLATGPGIDWLNVLFGSPDPSLLIFNGFGLCYDKSGHAVPCGSPDAVTTCSDNASCGVGTGVTVSIGPSPGGPGGSQPKESKPQQTQPEKPAPKTARQIASCMVPQLIDNFIGQGEATVDQAPVTVTVNIGLFLVLRTAVRSSPALVPGYGWVYVGLAVAYDAALIGKSYAACRQ